MRIILSILIALFYICNSLTADTYYWDKYFGFSPFTHQSKNSLVIHNSMDNNLIDTISVNVGSHNFNFEARVANVNNLHNKRYKYTNTDGSVSYVKHPSWGIVIYDDDNNKLEIKLTTSTTSDWEYISNDCVKVEIIYSGQLIDNKIIEYPKIEAFTKTNTIFLSRENSNFVLCIGARYKQRITDFEIGDFDIKSIGFIVYPGGKIDVERACLDISPSKRVELSTEWTRDAIDKYLSTSTDSLEGYWIYRDRSLDENLLRMGGDYTLALIKRENGYNLIYIEGATICKDKWATGMIKAILKPTKFDGSYHLIWYDAEMAPLHKDIVAHFDSASEMTISFPYQVSTIRLYRSNKP